MNPLADARQREAVDDLITLVYSSSAQSAVDERMLRQILEHSRAANARAAVTGMLLYRGGRFIQVLEGPGSAVRELFARIAADPRHGDVRLLVEEPTERRLFAEWTMGFEPIDADSPPPPAGFRDTFVDLESTDDDDAVARAVTELTVWFRARSGRPALPEAPHAGEGAHR